MYRNSAMPVNQVNSIEDVRKVLEYIMTRIKNLGPGADITNILKLIPDQASESNKLTDTNFVNSSIATNTATFRGTSSAGLTEEEFLAWANAIEVKDNNDYVFWNTSDADGNTLFKRYKYNGTSWIYEYTLNNSSFTAAQWATINSGITSQNAVKSTVVHNIVTLTQAQYDALDTKDANTEYNIIESV